MKDTQITISVASIPSRQEGLLETVHRLLPQCDVMNVCLNDYPWVPKGLDDPKINVVHLVGQDTLSDRGKFYWCKDMQGYHLTVDDDIVYPHDYVRSLVAKIEEYGRRAIISYHGSILLTAYGKLVNYPFSRQLIRFGDTTDCDVAAHMLGTGVSGYHTSIMNFDYTMMPVCGTDEHLAVHAQYFRIPMIIAKHDRGWILDNQGASINDPIHARKGTQKKLKDMLQGYKLWQLYGAALIK